MKIINSTLDSLSERLRKQEKEIMNACFFTNYCWYKNFIETVISKGSEECGFLVGEKKDGEINLILPFKYAKSQKGVRILQGLSNYYSPIFQISYENTCDPEGEALIAFFKKLSKILIDWDVLELRPLSEEDTKLVSKCLKKAGIPSVSFFCFGNWYLEVNGRSFDEYFVGLSSRVKNTTKRKSKKFEKIKGTRVVVHTQHSQIDEAIAAYEKVYNSSWKVNEPHPRFIPGLIRTAEDVGALRLGVAYIDDVAIAAQLWIVSDNTAYIFKLAYDEEYKSLSAGTILTVTLMRYVIDIDKVEVVDYLCGDDAYKKDWMTHRRERWGVMAFNTSTFMGWLEMLKHKSKFYLKLGVSKLKNSI